MTIKWYSITIDITNKTIVYYYISVNDGIINGFYNYNNIGINILAPQEMPKPFSYYYAPADNIFNIQDLTCTLYGINFTDTNLQQILNINTPYFNLYSYNSENEGYNSNILYLYQYQYQTDDLGINDASSNVNTDYINAIEIEKPFTIPITIPISRECIRRNKCNMILYKPVSTGGNYPNNVKAMLYSQYVKIHRR